MTEAQHTQLVVALGIHPDFDADNLVDSATEMLQSLPMVEGEPAAWQIKFKDQNGTQRQVTYTHNAIGDYRQIDPNAICDPLYTSPQPLQPITADDVTDEMIHNWHANTFGAQAMGGVTDRDMIVAAVNAFNPVKHRSEA